MKLKIVYVDKEGNRVFGRDESERLLLAWLEDWSEGRPLRDPDPTNPEYLITIPYAEDFDGV